MSTSIADAPKAEVALPPAKAGSPAESPKAAPTPLSYGYREPWTRRLNWRVFVFAAVMLLPISFVMYVFIDSVVTGGIKDAGGGYKEVDLKAMSVFPFDQINGTIDDVPRKWRDLEGKKVVLYGEIWAPQTAGNNLAGFQLCYSIAKCCFNGPPQVQHFVDSRAMPGKELEYYSNLVKVKGILHIDVKRDAGKVASVYQLDVESIEPG